MKYSNPKIREGINTSQVNPLKEFSFLVGVVLTAIILIVAIFVIMIDYTIDYMPFDFEN